MREFVPSGDNEIYTSFPLINAVLAGLQKGKKFIDEKAEDVFYFIHKAGFSYLAGSDNADYADVLRFLLSSKEIPGYFHLYEPPSDFIALCSKSAVEVNIKNRKRIQLKYTEKELKFKDTILPEAYTIRKIDANNFEKLSNLNLSLENKFWNSKEDFEKNGFGFCVFNEFDIPVSICYTACLVNQIAEIDVATLPAYQKMGLGKQVVNAFLEHCINNNIIANWDCFEDNYGSLKIAQSIGFKYIMRYNFLSVFNKYKV